MNLVALADLSADDIYTIWSLVGAEAPALAGTAAWSFEGNGVRTRATFLQAFRELGLAVTELPNLLKTAERVEDLAGYLDPLFALYVIRESDHGRLRAFARASSRPVVNAMSSQGHPCEVLADAYFVDRHIAPLRSATVCLWGPTTNVFRSWHELAAVLGIRVVQVCEERYHEAGIGVQLSAAPAGRPDIVITDAWPAHAEPPPPLTVADLAQMGSPPLLPTPPFGIGRELAFDPLAYAGFVGYRQKQLLLPVHRAILRFALGA